VPSWSEDVVTRTVYGTYITSRGIAGVGTVTFTPTSVIYDPDDTVVLSGPTVATLNAAGYFSLELPTTDNPLLTPSQAGRTKFQFVSTESSLQTFVYFFRLAVART
jgi:hypothetical protein